jgi:hypothetical protein
MGMTNAQASALAAAVQMADMQSLGKSFKESKPLNNIECRDGGFYIQGQKVGNESNPEELGENIIAYFAKNMLLEK